jgi:predicted dehydrogenase
MGRLHARVLSEMPGTQLVGVVDVNPAAARSLAAQRDCLGVTDARELLDKVNAAIIAVPTVHHVAAAWPFVEAGKDVLIEKPLADDPAAARKLIDLARRTGSRVQVGHTERFNPAVVALGKHHIQPKFIEANRISPFTFRSADVGVVLDMMIHDLDLVLMLVRGPVVSVEAVGINVIGAHEDICNARLTFASGCVANVTASRLAVKTERKMRIFSEQAYLSVDYGLKVGMVITKDANLDLVQMARDLKAADLGELAASMDYTKLLHVEQLVVDDSIEPLRRQAEAFRQTVENGAPPVVSAADGLAAVELAHQVVEAMKRHRWDGLASSREGLDVIRRP